MKFIDTHAHYNDENFKGIEDETIKKCIDAGVDRIINVGYDVPSSIRSIELSNKYEQIYAAIGIHPHDVDNFTAKDVLYVYNTYYNQKIVAIGEIGLDYAFVKDNKEKQKKLFIEQIELANTLKLPILIHSRDAGLDTYNILKNEKQAEYGTLFHCFQPTDDLVRLVIEKGYFVAFGGNITFKRNESFKEYIRKIPLDQIVIETDSPYLAPVPYRGTINTSANLPIICRKLSDYKGLNMDYVAEKVYNNSLRFYNIK